LVCANVYKSRPSYATAVGTEVAVWGRLHMPEERAQSRCEWKHSLTPPIPVSEVPSCASHVTRWNVSTAVLISGHVKTMHCTCMYDKRLPSSVDTASTSSSCLSPAQPHGFPPLGPLNGFITAWLWCVAQSTSNDRLKRTYLSAVSLCPTRIVYAFFYLSFSCKVIHSSKTSQTLRHTSTSIS